MAGDKIDVSFEINSDSEKLLDQIVEKKRVFGTILVYKDKLK